MTEQRQMTIKRGMTRLKTIQGQLDNITRKISKFAVHSDKHKHQLGDTTLSNSESDLKKNHAQARKAVESLYQQFQDLTEEYIKIKLAIDKANSETYILVAGKRMSLREALMYKQRDGVTENIQSLVNAYRSSESNAQRNISQYNSQFASVPEDKRQGLTADIISMVDREQIDKLDNFLIEFVTEVDGELDDAIVSTVIDIQ